MTMLILLISSSSQLLAPYSRSGSSCESVKSTGTIKLPNKGRFGCQEDYLDFTFDMLHPSKAFLRNSGLPLHNKVLSIRLGKNITSSYPKHKNYYFDKYLILCEFDFY
jgi:hypothetical protein